MYRVPSITPLSPTRPADVAVIVNAPRPRGLRIFTIFTPSIFFAAFALTFGIGTPRKLRTTRTGRADVLTRFARDAEELIAGRFGGIYIYI